MNSPNPYLVLVGEVTVINMAHTYFAKLLISVINGCAKVWEGGGRGNSLFQGCIHSFSKICVLILI